MGIYNGLSADVVAGRGMVVVALHGLLECAHVCQGLEGNDARGVRHVGSSAFIIQL